MSITRPCTVCGITMTVQSLKQSTCGPACEDLHARREAASTANVRPGHDYYAPTTEVQRVLHRKAVRKRIAASDATLSSK